MKVYRISEERYINDLSGRGSGYAGGRWNPKGRNVLYTSDNSALAVLEIIVSAPRIMFPETLWIAAIEIPENSIKTIDARILEKNWRAPLPTLQSIEIGIQWLNENKFLALKVPSVVVPFDYNYVLNPKHRHFKELKIASLFKYDLDTRLKNIHAVTKTET